MRSQIHRTRFYVPLSVAVVSLALLGWAFTELQDSRRFLASAIRTVGKVTRLEIQQDDARLVMTLDKPKGELITDPSAYTGEPETHILYTGVEGREDILKIFTSDNGWTIGSPVEVGYDPRDMGTARVLSFSTLYAWATGLAAAGASGLLGALILLIVNTQRQQKRPR